MTNRNFKLSLMLLASLIVSTFSLSTPAVHANTTCSPPPPNLVSWWPADGAAIDVADFNNGVLQRGATFAPGHVGLGFSLDGVDDYIDAGFGTGGNLDFGTDSFTFGGWIRHQPNGGGDFVASKELNLVGWIIVVESDGRVVFLTTSHPSPIISVRSPSSIDDGAFHYVVAIRNVPIGKLQLFLDGTLVAEAAEPLTNVNRFDQPLTIGSGTLVHGDQFRLSGVIDEVEIYSRALSASEIQTIFLAGSAGKCKPFSFYSGGASASLGPNGEGPTTSGLGPIGGNDPITMTAGSPAQIISQNGAWNLIPGTQWISNGPTTFVGPPNGVTVAFTVNFFLPCGATNPTLSILAMGDDFVTVYLNGNQLILGGVFSPGASFHEFGRATISTSSLFITGSDNPNVLRFDVQQVGGDGFGLNYRASVNFSPGVCIPPFDFAVSSSPSSRTIGQGQATSYDVTTTLVAGTAQSISLTVSGLPGGAAASFTPATITPAGSSTFFVTTDLTTPPATYTLTITAQGGGLTKATTVDLIVAPISSESFITDATFAGKDSFDVVFAPDQATGSFKLAATNPATYFYNKLVRNTGSQVESVTITLDIPSSTNPALAQAFVLKTPNPIKVYADLARSIDVTGTATISPAQPLPSPTTSVSTLSVSVQIPTGELRYVTVFLEFAGKGSTGFASDAKTTYRQGFKFRDTVSLGSVPGIIEAIASFTGVGKKVTAIGGFALDTNLNYKSALSVRVLSGATEIGVSPVTAPDGFYFVQIPSGGPYTVELFNPTTTTIVRTSVLQSIVVDEYVQLDFLNLNPADPAIEGFVFDRNLQGVLGITVQIYGPGGRLLASTATSAGGWYAFRFTQPGRYTIKVLAPEDYTAGVTVATVAISQFETLRVDFTLST